MTWKRLFLWESITNSKKLIAIAYNIQRTIQLVINNTPYGGYVINVESFDIDGILGRLRIMEDRNESLNTMGLQLNFKDEMDTCITPREIPANEKQYV